MTNSSVTTIETNKASGYLQQLCKHFGHKLDVEFTPQQGSIRFDFGAADLHANQETLTMTAMAERAENLARLERVLASHLERFAFRENLKIEWSS